MAEWDVFIVVGSIVSFVTVFAGVAWKFGSMISKLEGLIVSLSETVNRIEEDQKLNKHEISERLEDHEIRIRQTEITLASRGGKSD